jgi:general secretion pathway protein A
LINVLCDRALLGAYVEEKDQVDLKIMETAASEVLGVPRTSRKRLDLFYRTLRQPALWISLLFLLLASDVALATFHPKLHELLELNTQKPVPQATDTTALPETALAVPTETETGKRQRRDHLERNHSFLGCCGTIPHRP